MFREMLIEKGKGYCKYYAGNVEPLYIALEPEFIYYANNICDRCAKYGIDLDNDQTAQSKVNRTYFFAIQQFIVNHHEECLGDMRKKVSVTDVIDECFENEFGIARIIKK